VGAHFPTRRKKKYDKRADKSSKLSTNANVYKFVNHKNPLITLTSILPTCRNHAHHFITFYIVAVKKLKFSMVV